MTPFEDIRKVAAEEPFVLERTENPHPVMLVGALAAREQAERVGGTPGDWAYWDGYLQAMVDATGETREAIIAWMERVG